MPGNFYFLVIRDFYSWKLWIYKEKKKRLLCALKPFRTNCFMNGKHITEENKTPSIPLFFFFLSFFYSVYLDDLWNLD